MKRISFIAVLSFMALFSQTQTFGAVFKPVSEYSSDHQVPDSERPVKGGNRPEINPSEPLNHEIIALTTLLEEYGRMDDLREAQWRYTLSRTPGMYFEPRIMSAMQASQDEAAKAAGDAAKKDSAKKERPERGEGKDKHSGFGVGIKAGANISMLTNNYKGAPPMFGFTGGLFMEYILKNNIGIAVEAMYSKQGSQINSGTNTVTSLEMEKETLNLNYINVPILAKYNNLFIKGLGVEAGVQLGFLMSGNTDYQYGYFNTSSTVTKELSDDYSTLDIAIPIGLSYRFDFGLSLGLRYAIGVTNTNSVTGYKNQVGSFVVGYRF